MSKIYHRTYQRRRQEWDRIRDCIEGELRLKEAGQLYLRRPSGMDAGQYLDYLKGAAFYAVAERTVPNSVLVASVVIFGAAPHRLNCKTASSYLL